MSPVEKNFSLPDRYNTVIQSERFHSRLPLNGKLCVREIRMQKRQLFPPRVPFALTSLTLLRNNKRIRRDAFSNDHSGKRVGTLLPARGGTNSRTVIHGTSPFLANTDALRNGHKYSAGSMPLNRE